jgi:transcriptional regulator with XRE-family HTH domain
MRMEDVFAEIEARHPEIAEIAHEVDPPYILALNVIRLRRERGLTQAELANRLGVSQPRIAEVEAGDANPRLITLSKIAHALGVSLSELLTDNLNANRAAAVPAQVRGEENEPTRKRRVK